MERRSVEVNPRPGKPVSGGTSSSATSKMSTQIIGTGGGAVYDAAVALVDVLDKLTYPLTGSWDDKPACRPDQVSIINGYVCMYVCILFNNKNFSVFQKYSFEILIFKQIFMNFGILPFFPFLPLDSGHTNQARIMKFGI